MRCFSPIINSLPLLVACFALTTSGWVLRSPKLPFSLGEVASAVIGNSLYVVGQGSSVTCAIAIRPTLGSAWNCNLATRPSVGNHHAVVNPGDGTMWLFGGIDSEGLVCTNLIWLECKP